MKAVLDMLLNAAEDIHTSGCRLGIEIGRYLDSAENGKHRPLYPTITEGLDEIPEQMRDRVTNYLLQLLRTSLHRCKPEVARHVAKDAHDLIRDYDLKVDKRTADEIETYLKDKHK